MGSIFMLIIYIYILIWRQTFLFFLAVCRLSLAVASEGYSVVAVCGLLFAVASPVAEHRL